MPYVKTKTNYKRLFGMTFVLGTVAELACIAGGIYFYRKYNADDEFRNRLLRDYPQEMEMVHSVAAGYRHMINQVLSEETQAKILNSLPSFDVDSKASPKQDN